MQLKDFEYKLPKELIAQTPAKPKSSSGLMVVKGNKIEHKRFYDIVDYLKKGDVLVVNDTKVAKHKIVGKKSTGSKVELILMGLASASVGLGSGSLKSKGLRPRKGHPPATTKKGLSKEPHETDASLKGEIYNCRIQGKAKVGNKLIFKAGLRADVVGKVKDIYKVRFNKKNVFDVFDKIGELPLPPYVKKKLDRSSQYQTVYSKKQGSLAAPTAGLHFTPELLRKIKKKGVKIVRVCLHVGFGTFLPIKSKIKDHPIEAEYYEISEKAASDINSRKGRLIVVGTTTLKTLESSCTKNGKIKPGKGWSNLFIYPPYKFKSKPYVLITNFHLPKSTLILLVSAYYGRQKILNAYKVAVKEKYRFYSLGDATLLLKE